MRKALAGLACLSLVSACTPSTQATFTTVADSAIRNEIDQQIAQNGAEAASALRRRSAATVARFGPAVSSVVSDADLPADLRRKSTFEWSGPAQGVVQKLAGLIGYRYMEAGNPRGGQPMVNISLRETTVGQALADVGGQIREVAVIAVDTRARTIVFRNEPSVSVVQERVVVREQRQVRHHVLRRVGHHAAAHTRGNS